MHTTITVFRRQSHCISIYPGWDDKWYVCVLCRTRQSMFASIVRCGILFSFHTNQNVSSEKLIWQELPVSERPLLWGKGKRGRLLICLFSLRRAKQLLTVLHWLIGDLTADKPVGTKLPPSLVETTNHCPETDTSHLTTNLLPAFSSKHLEETPSPLLLFTQHRQIQLYELYSAQKKQSDDDNSLLLCWVCSWWWFK